MALQNSDYSNTPNTSTYVDVGRSYLQYDLTHVQHDPAHCLAQGLFRSLGPKDRQKLKLAVVYKLGDKQIEFSGPEPLGANDLRILQGLIALAAISGENKKGAIVTAQPLSEKGKKLREGLELKWDAVNENAAVAEVSFANLAKEIGYSPTTHNFTIMRECIERIFKVTVIVKADNKRLGFHLLSYYESENNKDKKDGKFYVALNPLLTNAVLGKEHYVRIDMNEVRVIQSDPARLIHQRLCAWIDFGETKRVDLNILCEYVWPDKTDNKKTLWKRQNTVRKALQEIAGLGWEIKEYSKNKFEIKRPGTFKKRKKKKNASVIAVT